MSRSGSCDVFMLLEVIYEWMLQALVACNIIWQGILSLSARHYQKAKQLHQGSFFCLLELSQLLKTPMRRCFQDIDAEPHHA